MSIPVNILGVKIDNLSLEEALGRVNEFLLDDKQRYIVLPYSEFFVRAKKDEEFRNILNKADLRLADGIGPIFASWILGRPLNKGRVRGIDLIYRLSQITNFPACVKASAGRQSPISNELRLFLYGGEENIANLVAERLWFKFPKMNIVGVEHGFHKDDSAVIDKVNQLKPNLLLVGLGFPKQEKWIYNNLSKMPSVKVAIGVGGAFDYISGRMKRAPRFMRALGIEWLWRLLVQPSRFSRIYNAVIIFPLLIIKERFKIKGARHP